MRGRPEHFDVQDVTDLVAEHWRVHVEDLDYLPEGAGAYHWVMRTADGRRWLLTCDDLDIKPWLGSDP